MRGLDSKSKLTIRSIPEVHEALSTLQVKLRRDGIVFNGKAISREVLVNAMALWLNEVPYERALEVLGEAAMLLEKELSRDVEPGGVELSSRGGQVGLSSLSNGEEGDS